MSFDDATLTRIRAARQVEIETTSTEGAVHRTVICVVADKRDAYIRSVRGGRGRWYRELRDRSLGALWIDGQRVAIRAVPSPDAPTVELVNRLLRAKYGRSSRASTEAMLRPETLPTTLRLEPT